MSTTHIILLSSVAGSIVALGCAICYARAHKELRPWYENGDRAWYAKTMTWCGFRNRDPDHSATRIRGAALPWEVEQIAMVCGLLIEACLCYAVLVPAITDNCSGFGPQTVFRWEILWVVHGAAALACLLLLIFLELYDPTAPSYASTTLGVQIEKRARQAPERVPLAANEVEARSMLQDTDSRTSDQDKPRDGLPWTFCRKCEELGRPSYCPGRYRYHCGWCNRCTIGFDHHCHWLNMCICSRNYVPWLGFVSSLVVKSWTETAIGIGCIFAVVDDRLEGWDSLWEEVVLISCGVVLAFISFLVGLFAFLLIVAVMRILVHSCATGEWTATYTWLNKKYHDDVLHADKAQLLLWRFLQGASLLQQGPITFQIRQGHVGPLWMTLPPGPERRAERIRVAVRVTSGISATEDTELERIGTTAVSPPAVSIATAEASQDAICHSVLLTWRLNQESRRMEDRIDAPMPSAVEESLLEQRVTDFMLNAWGNRTSTAEERSSPDWMQRSNTRRASAMTPGESRIARRGRTKTY